MSIEGLAAKRVALQRALGTRAERLLETQYDALIAAQYDTPEALLDASEGNLKEVLKPALGAVDAVLSWQRETKQGAGGAAGGSGPYGSVTIHVTRDALEKLGKAPGLEYDRDQVQLRAPGNLHVGRLAEDRNIKVLEYCITTSDAVPSAEGLKDKQPGTEYMIPVQPGQHVWLRCKRPGHNWLLDVLLGPLRSPLLSTH